MRRHRVRLSVAVWLAVHVMAAVSAAGAAAPDEMLKDPVLEARARDIGRLLRCVVCQNQSIDDSSAPLAQDLRVLVRERLTAGETDRQAIAFVVARYGNFVLLKPPFQFNTLLLWFGPLLLSALAGYGLLRTYGAAARATASSPVDELTRDDEKRLARLLGGGTCG